MTNLLRIDPDRMNFGWDPAQRVPKIAAALAEQRAHLRTAPAGSIDEDIARRNIDDLQQTLARAEVNEAAGRKQAQALEAAETAKRQEHDDRALAAIADQLRRNYLSQPGATLAGFEQALPRLLERQREDAALNAPALREQQLAEQRRRLGSF
jgi:hypothetical protein